MRKIFVLIATVLLGIAVAGFVGQFQNTIGGITAETNNEIEDQLTSSSGIIF